MMTDTMLWSSLGAQKVVPHFAGLDEPATDQKAAQRVALELL